MLPFSKRGLQLPLAVLAAALVAACGGGSPSSSGPTEVASAKASTPVSRPVPVRSVAEDALPQSDLRSPSQKEAKQADRAKPQTSKLYIVQLADDPVLAYQGGVAGLAATKPAQGKKMDP